MPILKWVQFSSIWEAGDPGTGRGTSGCNYTKSGSVLNAEQQSWIQCWTEVGNDWLMEWFACGGSGISFLGGVQDSVGCGPTQPDVIRHALSWGWIQWTPEVPSNLNYYLSLWRGSLYLGLSVPGSPENPGGVFLLAMPMEFGTPQEEVSACQAEDKLLLVFLLLPQTCKLLILISNLNTHLISSFYRHQEASVCMSF